MLLQIEEIFTGLEFVASGPRERNVNLGLDLSRPGHHDEDSPQKEDGFLHIVGHKHGGVEISISVDFSEVLSKNERTLHSLSPFYEFLGGEDLTGDPVFLKRLWRNTEQVFVPGD